MSCVFVLQERVILHGARGGCVCCVCSHVSGGTSNLFTTLIGITQSINAPRRGPNEPAQKTGELVKCYCWEAIIQQSGWLMQENDIH